MLSGTGTGGDGFTGTENNGSFGAGKNYDRINSVQGSTFGDNLTAPDTSNTWVITGPNQFTLNGGTVPFTGFASVTGGAVQDDFFVKDAGSMNAGVVFGINGGNGTNTITGSDQGDTWNITGSRAGDVTNSTGQTFFVNIDSINTGALTAAPTGADGSGNDTFNLNANRSQPSRRR